MPQIAMTEIERIQGLMQLGYTECEGCFLCLVALHGGYFQRRQFSEFTGKAAGGGSTPLIEKLLNFEHATVSTFRHNTHVYHLAARRLYAAIGQEDNRNRREKEALTIKNKLMGLDFVLANPTCKFLATEQEKVEFFSKEREIDASKLPAKTYRGRDQRAATVRYFVDKYPIFIPPSEGDGSASPVVSFCFVDEGLSTPSHFETFLGQYRPLFVELGQFHVIYVSAGLQTPTWAERTFARFVAKSFNLPANDNGHSAADLIAHFRQRRDYESKNLAAFDREKLLRYRQDRERFSGHELDAQFDEWKRTGLESQPVSVVRTDPAPPRIRTQFSAHLLPKQYQFFGCVNP